MPSVFTERRQAGEAARVPGLHPSPASLEGPGVPAPWCPTGGPSSQETGHLDRRIPDRLGSCLGRADGEGHVTTPREVGAHKRPRAEGHPSCLAEIPASATAPTRSGEDGQYCGNVLHKSPKGNKVPTVPPGGGGATDSGRAATLFTEGSAHPERGEQGSRHSLQDGATPGRMETEPGGRRPDLDAVGVAQADLFASAETTHCPEWYSLIGRGAVFGLVALSQEWPTGLL